MSELPKLLLLGNRVADDWTRRQLRQAADEIERLEADLATRDRREQRLVEWVLDEIPEGEEGCLTGDCRHPYISDCVAHLRARFTEEVSDA